MRNKRITFRTTTILVGVSVLAGLAAVSSGAVLGIDFGAHWIKAAVARPGFFDVVENEINERKTSAAVAFAPPPDAQRVLGKTGLRVLFRRPQQVFLYPNHLLGRLVATDAAAHTDLTHLPFATATDAARGTYLLQLNESYAFAPEELVGMVLRYVRRYAAAASKLAPEQLHECVVTVPAYATVHERQAMVDAAKLAGLDVVALVSAPAAFAVTYGMEKAPVNETQNLVIVDLGAAALEACFVTVTNTRSERRHQETALVNVRTSAWSRAVGGRDFVRRLTRLVLRRSGLAAAADAPDRRTYYRAEAVATKLLEVLSVNKDAHYKISMPEADYEGTVTRAEFEAECQDLLAQIAPPLRAAMARVGWTPANITYVQIVGGATRIPAVQRVLSDVFARDELQRHLSGDEGAAFGATYIAAQMSSSHRSRKTFVLRDATPFSVAVATTATADHPETTLYKAGARYGYSRSLVYTASGPQLNASLRYVEPSFQPEVHNCDGRIATYTVAGIPTRADHPNMTTDHPNVRLTFTLSLTGIVQLTEANAEYNETIVVQERRRKTVPGTNATEANATEVNATEANATEANATANNSTEAAPPVVEYETVYKEVVVPRKVRCAVALVEQCLAPRTSEEIHQMKVRMDVFDEEDRARRALQEARNSIESYVYKMREVFRDDSERTEFAKYAKDGVLDAIEANLSAAYEWLEDEGEDAPLEVLQTKLAELRAEGDKIAHRKEQAVERPKAVTLLQYSIAFTIDTLVNATATRNITDAEFNSTLASLKEIVVWLDDKVKAQEKQPLNEDPVLETSEIDEHMDLLKYYLKWINTRPYKSVAKNTAKPENETATNADANETNSSTADLDEEMEMGTANEEQQEQPNEKQEEKKEHSEL